MRVVWIQSRARTSGGCERYVAETAQLLREHAGVESTLLYEVEEGTDAAYLAGFDAAFPIVDLARQLRELAPDAVYVHQVRSDRLPALASCSQRVVAFWHDHKRLCLREHKLTAWTNKPCAATVGVGCYTCPGFLGRTPQGGLRVRTLGTLRAELEVFRGFAAHVVGSHYMAKQLRSHGVPAEAIQVVPLYVRDLPDVPFDRDAGKVLYVGAMTRGKGVDDLIRAFALTTTPGAQLLLVGDGPQRREFEALAARLGVAERVAFLGAMSPDGLYRQASLGVVPSRAPESFGLVGLEAMARGLPVVATEVGGIPEWLIHEVTGLLTPAGQAAPMAEAIDRLLGNPRDASRMGHAGRQRARSAFRADRHLRGLLDVLTPARLAAPHSPATTPAKVGVAGAAARVLTGPTREAPVTTGSAVWVTSAVPPTLPPVGPERRAA